MTAPLISEQRVTLGNVRWETYECLLRDLENSSAPRLTYDRGTLEIMSPLPVHERDNRNVQMIVEILAEEWGINVENLGSMTLKREDLARGFEPDSCFYIANADRMAGQGRIDLAGGDPAPDLVIEVDLTHPSLDKLPLYAEIGVPEIWRLSGANSLTIEILGLTDGAYQTLERSVAFPLLTRDRLADFVAQSRTLRRLDWLRFIRDWARQQA